MHLETQRGNETRNVLIDFGYSSPTLLNNLDILGIDPAKLDAMVLSHGHYDHFGGMVGFLSATQGKRKPKLPLYIGGEECFCSRQFTVGPTPLNFGALDRKAIAEGGFVRHYRRRTGGDRRPCLRYWSHRAGDVRTGAIANPDEGWDRQRSWLLP
jgi:7,8-dihydropterin-6-yl-methyl-4-(beta-D-ribofuranosyl)aminobenzene 5'-phosphate synthase